TQESKEKRFGETYSFGSGKTAILYKYHLSNLAQHSNGCAFSNALTNA
ncbi:MAG: hypothetical protein ACI8RD_014101, partial [Bacillariaceae sp.]